MADKYRKERYIRQIKNKKGWSFQVRYKNRQKIFTEKRYGDPRIAFNKAIEYRNELINQNVEYSIPHNKNIYDVMEESFDLLIVRQKTRNNHISLFNAHIKDKISVFNFDEPFIYSKLNAMVDKYNDDTISRVYNLFKRIDKTCLIKGYYDKSVIASMICPESRKHERKTLKEPITKEELDLLIQKCTEQKNEYDCKQLPIILEFMYLTGLRPCEVWCLTWKDISDAHISINKEVGSDNSSVGIIRPTKTKLSYRAIPLTPKLKTLLKRAENESELIFPDENGRMYDTDLIGKKLTKIAKKAGIKFNLYDLRHRFATDLTLNGIDDRTKMELMGHANISMTLDYARSNDDKKIEALEKR